MQQVIDISQPINNRPSCSFALVDTVPRLSFEEGDSHGVTFVTSRLDNFRTNTCTHIDFPGHLASLGRQFPKAVGHYPIERFIGPVFILDVSQKMAPLLTYFDKVGKLAIDKHAEADVLNFLNLLDTLSITRADIENALKTSNCAIEKLSGLLLYTGLSDWWRNEKFESWEYIYFYGPFLSENACDLLVANRLSFVGIDGFQLDHPIINFNGHELPLVLHSSARQHVSTKLEQIDKYSNHHSLLGKDILIYENLRIPPELRNREVMFSGVPLNLQLEGLNDNALARPYVTVVK